ncbi:MAG: hypothetical protein ACR2PO_17800, partial [Methyloligellaceae bacterium]
MGQSHSFYFRMALVAAGAAVATLIAIDTAAAQKKKVPGWAQGRPAELENSPLAPHPSNLKVTPADKIPLDKIQLPPGFKVEI